VQASAKVCFTVTVVKYTLLWQEEKVQAETPVTSFSYAHWFALLILLLSFPCVQ